MIVVYGMPSCPDCAAIDEQIEERDEFQYIDIGQHVKNLKAFLKVRDNSPVFDEAKKMGYVGIPCFVLEDGTVTLNPADVGLKSAEELKASTAAEGQACRLDGSGC